MCLIHRQKFSQNSRTSSQYTQHWHGPVGRTYFCVQLTAFPASLIMLSYSTTNQYKSRAFLNWKSEYLNEEDFSHSLNLCFISPVLGRTTDYKMINCFYRNSWVDRSAVQVGKLMTCLSEIFPSVYGLLLHPISSPDVTRHRPWIIELLLLVDIPGCGFIGGELGGNCSTYTLDELCQH